MVHFYPWFKYYFLLLQTCHYTLHITIANDKTEKNKINDKNSSLEIVRIYSYVFCALAILSARCVT